MYKEWRPSFAAAMVESLMASMADRWAHVQAVGRTAESLAAETDCVSAEVVVASWLHDVGYAPRLRSSGFHPLDGARFLVEQSAPAGVVSLVAYHTGATYEAEERGLAGELAAFDRPNETDLDLLTFIDLTVGPTGRRVGVRERLDEMVARYPEDDPVQRALSRSRPPLIKSCERAVSKLDLSDEWLSAAVETVLDP